MDFETGFWPNLLGLTGVAFNIGWPFFRGRTAMLLAQAAGCFAFAAHYLLLGAHTGGLMVTLAGVQALVAIPVGTDPRFRMTYLAILPVIAATMALSWMGVPSAFAAAAMAVVSLGRYQTNVVRFRVLMLACIPFWVGHNILVGSIPGLLSDALSFSAGAWMLYVTLRRAPGAAVPVP